MSQHPIIRAIENAHRRTDIPQFRAGDSVKVHTLIKEGDKERVQVFEGVVIDRRSGGSRATFTVRKISYGVGVERIEVLQHGRVRRARLNYLRQLQGRAARIKGDKPVSEAGAQAAAAKAAAKAEAKTDDAPSAAT